MNNKLKELFQIYLNNFDLINDDSHYEFGKWEYFKEFSDNFDIDADDFGGMFKKAIKGASFLVDNSRVNPTNGIVYFAEKPETKEQVRELFKALYADDNGDIKFRQAKIEDFVGKFNEMRVKYDPKKWKFDQTFRSGLLYLTLFDPDNNYLFKATQANRFRDCIEYMPSFGRGTNFSLKAYYDMCDTIVEKIKEMPELVEEHRNRITGKMYKDENLTLLAFDIIYVCAAYGYCTKSENTKHSKKMTKAERDSYARAQSLLKQFLDAQNELEKLNEQYDDLQDVSIVGTKIKHKLLGAGTVTEQDGTNVTIEFSSKTCKYQLPTAFNCKTLSVEDETVVDYFKERYELDIKIKRCTDRLNNMKDGLKRY